MSRLMLVAALAAAGAQAQGFDFTRQEVSIDLTGASPAIELTLTVTATRATGAFDFIIPPANVDAFDVDGASVVPGTHPTYPQYLYRVALPTPLTTGQSAQLHARISGAMRCMPPGQPPACFTGADGTVLLPTNYDVAWYFVNLYAASDPFEGRMVVRAPAAQTVIAGHGAGAVVDVGGGTKQWTYPLATSVDMMFVAAADYASVEATGPYTVKAYFPPSLPRVDRERRAAEVGAQVLPIYGRLFGDLPVREAHLITAPPMFPVGGMGLLANVFLADFIFGDMYGYLLEQGVAHELAHSWWGNLTSGTGEESGFMNEAFAEYSAWRALGELQGDAARTSGVRMNAVWYMYRTPTGADVAPVSIGVEQKPGFIWVTYHKGSVALRAMEEAAGVAPFTAGLKALAAMGPGQASLAALVDEVKSAGGADLTSEVEQWLKQPGFPKLEIDAKASGMWALKSTGSFSYRLPVRVRYADGRVVESVVQVTAGASEVPLALDGDVETIEADPRWTLPREVKSKTPGDVTLDGVVDGRDLLEVAVRVGGALPTERRVDGRYDPLFDVDADLDVDVTDLTAVVAAAMR